MGDYLCFSNFEALNKSENFEYIKNFTMEDSAEQVGAFSYCHTLIENKNNIFAIDNDRDGSFPLVHKLLDEDNNLSFFKHICTISGILKKIIDILKKWKKT